MYTFSEQLAKGEGYETVLDKYYGQWFSIQSVSMSAQKMGIDKVYTNIMNGCKYTIEYKADEKTAKTNNVFVETVSVDTTNKPGWAYTSCAQILVYYLPQMGIAVRHTMTNIKALLKDWLKKYPKVPCQNNGYKTWGVLVPLSEFEKFAKIDKIDPLP